MKKPLYADWTLTPAGDCLQTGEHIDQETLFHFKQNALVNYPMLIQMSEVADIVDGEPLYDTIYREHSFAPWIYGGQCSPKTTVNKNPALMPMIYVCSQYRADTKEELHQNIAVAKWACRKIADGGAIPIAPHLYFPRFIDENEKGGRYFGMGAGKRLLENCVSFCVVTVDGVISEGMAEEIKYANEVLQMEGSSIELTGEEAQKILWDGLEN